MTSAPLRTPSLAHDLVVLSAPTQAWSGQDAQMRAGVHGIMHADVRYVDRLVLTVGGAEPEHLATRRSASHASVTLMARGVDDAGKDPHVIVTRDRAVTAGLVAETIALENASEAQVTTVVRLEVGTELAPLATVRAGAPAGADATAVPTSEGAEVRAGQRMMHLRTAARVETGPDGFAVEWDIDVPPGGAWAGRAEFQFEDAGGILAPAGDAALGEALAVTADAGFRTDLDRWRAAARDDLAALLACGIDLADAPFATAGAPWYLTLFGRDALWTSRLLLPDALELAHGTLGALAAHQATSTDLAAASQPGKILHERRAAPHGIPREGLRFPAVYYGSVDATPLWVVLLNEARVAGLSLEEVRSLREPLHRALAWMRDEADPDGDGFLEYVDTTGSGLANQGWKDSADAVRFADGTEAAGPVALCEVQGYAYQAALAGADLLDALGEDGGLEWREWAERLQRRFREAFWVARDGARFPAMALDRDKRPADALTSNIGHLLGTGLLSAQEEAAVRDALMRPSMRSGWGLRTMASDERAYWPLSYHCGSVWAHDTAIAIDGLLRAGFTTDAAALAQELLDAASALDFRMPELFGGQDRDDDPAPIPHPTACVPQAWSAAAAAAVSRALAV